MIVGRTLSPGAAVGRCLVLSTPLSFWGGTDASGRVTDVRHPQYGAELAGRVVVMETGRGSSSSSSVLAEQIRVGAAPAALVLAEADPILVIAALVASELYGLALPIVLVDRSDLARLVDGLEVRLTAAAERARIDVESVSAGH